MMRYCHVKCLQWNIYARLQQDDEEINEIGENYVEIPSSFGYYESERTKNFLLLCLCVRKCCKMFLKKFLKLKTIGLLLKIAEKKQKQKN